MTSPNYGLNYLDAGNLWSIFSPNPVIGLSTIALEAQLATIANTFNQLVNFIDGKSFINSITVTLASAQIKALFQTPVSLAVAPGMGKAISVIGFAFEYKFGTHSYNAVDPGAFIIGYGSNPVPTAPTQAVLLAPDFSTGGRTNVLLCNPVSAIASAFPGGLPSSGNSGGVDLRLIPTSITSNQPLTMARGGTSYNSGPIVSAVTAAGGTGYAVGDTGTIDGDLTFSDGDATYIVTTVAPITGAVTGFMVSAPGTNYSVVGPDTGGVNYSTVNGGSQPGVGVGFTVNVTAVTAGDGTLTIILYYQTINL